MRFDTTNTPSTVFLAFNGEIIGALTEADTDEGYIIQMDMEDYDRKVEEAGKATSNYHKKIKQKKKITLSDWEPFVGAIDLAMVKTIRKEGRVDFIGDSQKDDPQVLFDRLNKIRVELGLEPYPSSPIWDLE